MAGVKVTAEQATTKWVNRLSGATAEIQQGVQSVTSAPGQAAAKQKAKWFQKLTASQDKWERAVSRVSLSDWQNAMTNVGIPRIAQGAQQKQGKFQAFAAEFFPYLEKGVQAVNNMPSTTIEDSINRATAMIRHNAGFKRSAR